VNRWIVAALVLVVASACRQPFGLGLPSERALESGAGETLSASQSYEITGSYTVAGDRWTIDLQAARPQTEHVVASSSQGKVEAIIIGTQGYFRGQQFLAQHMGTDPLSQTVVKVAGNAWWKGAVSFWPQFADLTDGATFKATFLGSAVTHRTDGVSVDGIDAVQLSGARADVFVAAAPPYHLLRVRTKDRVAIDGVTDADLHYGSVDRDFGIAAPTDVIDFDNLSTLPPIYTVLSVDTAACGSPCVVSAQLRNLGGMTGAKARSTVKFEMRDAATNAVIGACVATVVKDVGYNATTTASCTVGAQATNGATVIASVDNPGHG
jgi:hypothetical protein